MSVFRPKETHTNSSHIGPIFSFTCITSLSQEWQIVYFIDMSERTKLRTKSQGGSDILMISDVPTIQCS